MIIQRYDNYILIFNLRVSPNRLALILAFTQDQRFFRFPAFSVFISPNRSQLKSLL